MMVFLGVVLASCSSIFAVREEDSLEENGVKYSISGNILNGTKITRYFRKGDRMTVRFTHSLKPPYFDFYLINFTIISPSSGSTVFWFELEPLFIPYSGQTQLVVKSLTIGKSAEDINTSLTTQSSFVGEACQGGNYTLIFTSPYPFQVLSYVAFVKIVTIKEYPYAAASPVGITLIFVGAAGMVWAVFKVRDRPRGRIKNGKLMVNVRKHYGLTTMRNQIKRLLCSPAIARKAVRIHSK